jgi:hypothetical protein
MLANIANKYALAEEVTLDNKDTKKDKELSQSDQPNTYKNNDKKRKLNWCVANVEQQCHNSTMYRPRLGEFKGFLDRICIFHPRENTRLETMTRNKGLRWSPQVDQKGWERQEARRSEGDLPEVHKEVNYIYGGPDSYESRRKQKLIAWEVMAIRPITPEYLKWSEVLITFD